MTPSVAPRETARPASPDLPFDAEADVVVVGGGGGGLPAALFSRWLGNEVVLLEKAAGARRHRQQGRLLVLGAEQRADARARHRGPRGGLPALLRAAVARRSATTPTARRSGSTPGSTTGSRAIYDSASPAAELLAERGALPYRHCEAVPDYWSELPEDKAPTGRVLVPRDARESMSDGGLNAHPHAERGGASATASTSAPGHRVQRRDHRRRRGGRRRGDDRGRHGSPRRRAQGRRSSPPAASPTTSSCARNFLAAPGLRRLRGAHQRGRLRPHRAAPLGAQLRNMNYAWMCPIPLEKALARDPDARRDVLRRRRLDALRRQARPPRRQREAALQRAGAGVLRLGRDRGRVPATSCSCRSGTSAARSTRASDEYGRLIVGAGRRRRARHPRRDAGGAGATAIARALERSTRTRTGGAAARRRLPANAAGQHRALQRAAPRRGVDEDFGRGERAVQQLFNGDVQEEPGRAEPDDVAARRRAARTTPRSSPAARWTPRAARRPTPTAQVARRPRTSRSPASTASATASRRASAPRLLGGRRDARPDHRLRLPRGAAPRTPSRSSPRRWPRHRRGEPDGSRRTQTMTDEQRKSVALEYLKAFDNGGVTSTGGEHPRAVRRRRAGLLPEVGHRQRQGGDRQAVRRRRRARCKSIRHDYANFNWIFSGSDTIVAEGTSATASTRTARGAPACRSGARAAGATSSRSATAISSAASSTSTRTTRAATPSATRGSTGPGRPDRRSSGWV